MHVTSYNTQTIRANIGNSHKGKWIDLIIEDAAGEITITLHIADPKQADAIAAAINSTVQKEPA